MDAVDHYQSKRLFERLKNYKSEGTGLYRVVNTAVLPICTTQTTGLCGVLPHHGGWWHQGWDILTSFFEQLLLVCPACCSNIDHLTSGDEAEPLKISFSVSMINWLHARYADFYRVPHWEKWLKTGIGYVEK